MAIDHTDPNYIDMAITKAHLAAGDWALNEFHHSNPFNSYYFYLRDFETDVTAPRRKRRGFPLLRPLLPNWQINAGLHG